MSTSINPQTNGPMRAEQQAGWLLRSIAGGLAAASVEDCDESVACAANKSQVVTRPSRSHAFVPPAPTSLEETGLPPHQIEALILKFLMNRGVASGATIAKQVRLPFGMIDELLGEMKNAQLLAHKRSSGNLGDFEYQLTSAGVEQAKRYSAHSTYYGAAPVPFQQYVASVAAQSVKKERLTAAKLQNAMADLSLNKVILSRLGQAMTAGRALFIYGEPGNGKTSIAERLTAAFGHHVWIPRAVSFDDEIVRLYDPIMHEAIPFSELTHADGIDQRWIRVRRPTIVVGGELTMDNLEITLNEKIGVLEAPVQLKANCGTLVIDDFGRQRMRPDELLNRWIVPLEKQHDYLNLPSGKKIQVPFDQLIVFSTNLDPQEIVDEAFLRRIPYKIKVPDPTEDEFRGLLRSVAEKLGIKHCDSAVEHLIEQQYRQKNRPYRYCHPRDLLQQIRHLCEYHELPPEMTEHYLDIAAENYFTAM